MLLLRSFVVTLKAVAEAGGPGSKRDAMPIDGDHRCQGARNDISNMRPLARTLDRNSLVLMDDLQCKQTNKQTGWPPTLTSQLGNHYNHPPKPTGKVSCSVGSIE